MRDGWIPGLCGFPTFRLSALLFSQMKRARITCGSLAGAWAYTTLFRVQSKVISVAHAVPIRLYFLSSRSSYGNDVQTRLFLSLARAAHIHTHHHHPTASTGLRSGRVFDRNIGHQKRTAKNGGTTSPQQQGEATGDGTNKGRKDCRENITARTHHVWWYTQNTFFCDKSGATAQTTRGEVDHVPTTHPRAHSGNFANPERGCSPAPCRTRCHNIFLHMHASAEPIFPSERQQKGFACSGKTP